MRTKAKTHCITAAVAAIAMAVALTTTADEEQAPTLAEAEAAYENGEFDQSEEILRMLTDAGNAKARYMLAQHLLGMNADPAHITEARALLTEGDAAGHAPSTTTLGMLAATGTGQAQDPEAAIEKYHKAASAGHVPAQIILGETYRTGSDGVQIDLGQAARWFEAAARQKSEPGAVRLGQLLTREGWEGTSTVEGTAWLIYARSLDGFFAEEAAAGIVALRETMSPDSFAGAVARAITIDEELNKGR